MNRYLPPVRDVPANELTACLQFLLGKLRIERAQWVVAQLTDRVERKRIADIFAVESRQVGHIQAAALAILQHPGAATLLALGLSTEVNRELPPINPQPLAVARQLLARLTTRLAAMDVQFLQAVSESFEQGELLRQVGFVHLADLVFLVLERQHFRPTREPDGRDWRFQVVGEQENRLDEACSIAAATFAATLDCPRLSDFRSAAEIVAGYRTAPLFDPQLWQILMVANKPAGCLFLTQHRDHESVAMEASSTSSGAIEISYMGLLPNYRGQGLGELVLAAAVRVADQLGAARMVLAVDRKNAPAIALYRRRGWTEAAQETAWGIKISP